MYTKIKYWPSYILVKKFFLCLITTGTIYIRFIYDKKKKTDRQLIDKCLYCYR